MAFKHNVYDCCIFSRICRIAVRQWTGHTMGRKRNLDSRGIHYWYYLSSLAKEDPGLVPWQVAIFPSQLLAVIKSKFWDSWSFSLWSAVNTYLYLHILKVVNTFRYIIFSQHVIYFRFSEMYLLTR